MTGISYLDKNFAQALAHPPQWRSYDDDHYVLDRILQSLEYQPVNFREETRISVEQLLLHIFTEMQSTPSNSSQGGYMSSIQSAYIPIVRALVSSPQALDGI